MHDRRRGRGRASGDLLVAEFRGLQRINLCLNQANEPRGCAAVEVALLIRRCVPNVFCIFLPSRLRGLRCSNLRGDSLLQSGLRFLRYFCDLLFRRQRLRFLDCGRLQIARIRHNSLVWAVAKNGLVPDFSLRVHRYGDNGRG